MFMYKSALEIEVPHVKLAWQLQIRMKGFVCFIAMKCVLLHIHLKSMGVLLGK